MKTRTADYKLLSYVFILIVFGLIVLSFASVAIGVDRFNDPNFFLKRQLLFGVIPGFVAFVVMSKINYKKWKEYAFFIFILALALLLLVFIPGLGASFGTGARSWLKLGGISIQPAELVKLALIIFLAAFITQKGRDLKQFKSGFLMTLGFGLIPVALVALQPDIGTTSILFGMLFAVLFMAGAQMKHLLALLAAGLAGFAAMIAVAPYRAARFMTFLHPELDPQGIGYHINQAFLAIGSGGWFGLGLGHSRQKFSYLPEVHADSIFAIMAEEMGFIVASLLVLFIVAIVFRGFKIAKAAPDQFSRLLVSGIMIWFAVQSFLNIGAMVGLLPLTGVPLPFISHGGTALMVAMGAVGIVINVSKYAKVS